MIFRPHAIRQPNAGQSDGKGTSSNGIVTTICRTVRSRDLRVPTVCGLLVLAVAIVFGQTASYEFINYDDKDYVCENPHVRGGITASSIAWAFTAMHADNWHPLTWLSHMVDYQLYGMWAGGHHLTSVLLHAVNAVLLFLVLRQMTRQFWPSVFVAAVFAIHPLRVESVAWVAERKDVLSGIFFLLTLWAYGSYARAPFSLWRYLAVVLAFVSGLMAKPMLVTLPFVLLLLDYWPLNRCSWRNARLLMVEKCPLLVVAAAVCATTLIAQVKPTAANLALSLVSRLANAVVAYGAYLVQFFWPLNLALFYPHPANQLPLWKIAVSLVALVAISSGVVTVWRKHPYLVVGWLWYLGMLVPVIGLIQVGGQAMADRYTYLPQIGIAVMLVWGVDELRLSWAWRPKMIATATSLLLICLMVLAWLQTSYWHDRMSLWQHSAACMTDNYLAHGCLAECFADLGQTDRSLAEYQAVLKIRGADPEISHQTYYYMGIALDRADRPKEAVRCYEQSLRICSNNPDVCFHLAHALFNSGQTGEAIEQYRQTVRLKPDYSSAYNNLGNALLKLGRIEEATQQYEQAVRVQPDYTMAQYNLGLSLAKTGRRIEALRHLKESLRLADASGQKSLARVAIAEIQRLQGAKPAEHLFWKSRDGRRAQ